MLALKYRKFICMKSLLPIIFYALAPSKADSSFASDLIQLIDIQTKIIMFGKIILFSSHML